uniref:Uncharacterized protein n=1 Tax=Anguilla anguilla TaxID=7936 RepID=A0A0E9VLT6_ANGAN
MGILMKHTAWDHPSFPIPHPLPNMRPSPLSTGKCGLATSLACCEKVLRLLHL